MFPSVSDATSTSQHAAPHCANCSAQLTGPYCAQCGQHGHVETPTLWEFVHEYLHHYVALEGRLVRSLWLLLRHPGALTTEFLAGRRQRYVKPLQLYLTISFLFFIALNLFGVNSKVDAPVVETVSAAPGTKTSASPARAQAGPEAPAAPSAAARAAPAVDDDEDASTQQHGLRIALIEGDSGNPLVKKWNAAVHARQAEYDRDHQKMVDGLVHQALRYAPYGVFLLMPVFACLLKLLYFRRRMVYGAHLVFSLHVHALSFLVFGALLLPLPSLARSLVGVALPLYHLRALHRVYGGRLRALLPRAVLLFAVYGLLVVFALLGIVALAVTNV